MFIVLLATKFCVYCYFKKIITHITKGFKTEVS